MYLRDTDYIFEALANRQPALGVLDRLAGSRFYVTLGEAYESAFRSADPRVHLIGFRHFLGFYGMLGLNDPIMERFAETPAFLRRRGQRIGDLDLHFAATAIHHDLTLLTFNPRHFERVPDLKLYQTSSHVGFSVMAPAHTDRHADRSGSGDSGSATSRCRPLGVSAARGGGASGRRRRRGRSW